MECCAWVKGDRPLRRRWLARKRAERKPGRVQALAASPPYFKGLGSLFRSLVSAFQVGYYDRHCTEENPEARQVRTHTHTHRAELGSKPQVCAPTKPTAKSCFSNTMDPQGRAQPHCSACKCTGRVGKGPESRAPQPGSSAPSPKQK